MCIPSPVDTDIFRISEENVLDDRRRSANAIRPKFQTPCVKWMNKRKINRAKEKESERLKKKEEKWENRKSVVQKPIYTWGTK